MMLKAFSTIFQRLPFPVAKAHCDGPCGVYDSASARVAAEAVLSMTKKLLAMEPPQGSDPSAWATYNNTFSRYVAIKEEQAKEMKFLGKALAIALFLIGDAHCVVCKGFFMR